MLYAVGMWQVEQYKSIFTASERKKSAEKIYRTYCMQGAPWQATALPIKDRLRPIATCINLT
eukprot:3052671-Pleurochrysis_carterae.AAC.3